MSLSWYPSRISLLPAASLNGRNLSSVVCRFPSSSGPFLRPRISLPLAQLGGALSQAPATLQTLQRSVPVSSLGVIFRPSSPPVSLEIARNRHDLSLDLSLNPAAFRRTAVAGTPSKPGIRFPASTSWKVLESRSQKERREPPNR